MRQFLVAISFLTVIPVSPNLEYKKGDLGRSSVWFPFIGVLLGGLTALVFFFSSNWISEYGSAVLCVLVWIVLTGGLHLDGLADCCDAMIASQSQARRLEILKDPRLGTFGTLGLLFSVLIKIFLVAELNPDDAILLIPFAAGLARWGVILLGKISPFSPGGLSEDFSSQIQIPGLLVAVVPLIAWILIMPWTALTSGLLVICLVFLLRRTAMKKLAMINGDVMGLLIELSELLILLTGTILLG